MNIQWHNERRKVSELSDHPNNPRLQTERGMAALKKSIERSGYADVICINTDGTILSGHARKKQLLELGFDEIDVRVPGRALDEQEQRYYMVEANKAIAGEFDFEVLANVFEVEELKEVGFTDFDLGIGQTTATGASSRVENYLAGITKKFEFYVGEDDYEPFVEKLREIKATIGAETNNDVFFAVIMGYK